MDQLSFKEDIESYIITDGEADGKWMIERETIGQTWPIVFIWITAPPRTNGPEKFCFRFTLSNYPINAPEICLWDFDKNILLEEINMPKGTGDIPHVFRLNWEHGLHIYTPYERVTFEKHKQNWPDEYPLLVWRSGDNIVKALEHLYSLFNHSNYYGT